MVEAAVGKHGWFPDMKRPAHRKDAKTTEDYKSFNRTPLHGAPHRTAPARRIDYPKEPFPFAPSHGNTDGGLSDISTDSDVGDDEEEESGTDEDEDQEDKSSSSSSSSVISSDEQDTDEESDKKPRSPRKGPWEEFMEVMLDVGSNTTPPSRGPRKNPRSPETTPHLDEWFLSQM